MKQGQVIIEFDPDTYQTRQATLLAFIDVFRLFAFISLACIPLVLLIQKGHGEDGPKLMH